MFTTSQMTSFELPVPANLFFLSVRNFYMKI